jgi:uncharacterized membrane protein YtjA (UPF0391 family)
MFTTFIVIGVILLIASILLYAMGARGTAGMTAGAGRFLVIIGVVLALVFLVLAMLNRA